MKMKGSLIAAVVIILFLATLSRALAINSAIQSYEGNDPLPEAHCECELTKHLGCRVTLDTCGGRDAECHGFPCKCRCK